MNQEGGKDKEFQPAFYFQEIWNKKIVYFHKILILIHKINCQLLKIQKQYTRKTRYKKMDKVSREFKQIIIRTVLMQARLPKKNKWKSSNKAYRKEQACWLQKNLIEKVKLMGVWLKQQIKQPRAAYYKIMKWMLL